MTSVQVNIQQGTPEWHDLISRTIGGSEVGILFGLGHITRDELIRQKATGIVPEPSEFQAALFAKGHEIEDFAREYIGDLYGDEFFPAVFLDEDNKSRASLDGINLAGDTIIEIKTINKKNKSYAMAGEIDPMYIPQVVYGMGMSGAEKCLFIVSDGMPESTYYVPVQFDIGWFETIQSAITQFWLDVDVYQPEQSKPEPVLMPVMQLPALNIRVAGDIAISSNLETFGDKLTGFIAGINRDPQTDEDFGNLETAVKTLKQAEDALKKGMDSALGQTSSIDDLIKRVEYFIDCARNARLSAEKLTKTRKEEIRNELIIAAKNEYAKYCASLEREIDPIKLMLVQPDFSQAIKGVKTMASLRDKLNTSLANAKILASDTAADLRVKLAWYKENCLSFNYLFGDLKDIIRKPLDDFKLNCESRIERHKQAEQEKAKALAEKLAEQEREKIRQDEERKAREDMRIEQERERENQKEVDRFENEQLKKQKELESFDFEMFSLFDKEFRKFENQPSKKERADQVESELSDEQRIRAILQSIADKGEGQEVDRLWEAFQLGVQSVIQGI
jgi:putative phage-type endonuclease